MTSRRYPPRRQPPRPVPPPDLPMRAVGLGSIAQLMLVFLSLFPLVGIVLGFYYASQEHYGTRSFGRLLLAFAVVLHFFYFCVLCPLLFYLTIA